MKYSTFIIYWRLIAFVMLSSCGGKKANGKAALDTENLLKSVKVTLLGIDFQQNSIKIGNEKFKTLSLESVIPKDVINFYYIDGWGNSIHCMTDGKSLYVWSNGPNQIDDSRYGDDMVIELDIYDKLKMKE